MMASITIRNLDSVVKERLSIRAAEHGRSIAEEAHDILRQAVSSSKVAHNLAASIRMRVEPSGGYSLNTYQRELMREPILFDRP